jgi:CDP-paratose 2-epimerase
MLETLVTGGAGFVGCNLVAALCQRGDRVRVFDNLSRPGVERNLEWLLEQYDSASFVQGDIRSLDDVTEAFEGVGDVFHLAAQVAVTASLEDPITDFAVNAQGTLHVLEAARHCATVRSLVFTSTNKVYGALEDLPTRCTDEGYQFADGRQGISEERPLDFYSPYGCSKGAADQYVRDYARIYNVPSVVLRMSCVYGPHQWGTEDQGWVAHMIAAALREEDITVYGDGCQVRDLLYVADLVRVMLLAADRIEEVRGRALNVGGGPGNAVSVKGLLARLRDLGLLKRQPLSADWRPGDQRVYISDVSAAGNALGWRPKIGVDEGLRLTIEWIRENAL